MVLSKAEQFGNVLINKRSSEENSVNYAEEEICVDYTEKDKGMLFKLKLKITLITFD